MKIIGFVSVEVLNETSQLEDLSISKRLEALRGERDLRSELKKDFGTSKAFL